MVKRIFDVALAADSAVACVTSDVARRSWPSLSKAARPIFLWQERVGRGGRPFLCVKFRSMRADAEGDGVARWASAQ